MASINPRELVLLGAVAILALAPWMLDASGVSANHSWAQSDPKHLNSQHFDTSGHGFWDEDACVTSYDMTAVPQSTAYTIIYATLLTNGTRWDRPQGDSRIDIYVSATDCYTLEQSGGDSEIEMKYYIGHPSTASICGSSSSCVSFYRPIPTVNPSHHGLALAWMKTSHVPISNFNERTRNLSHETGHFWGLRDPNQINDYYGGCFSAQDVYTYSVMHQYETPNGYCNTSGGYPVPYVVYPTTQDFLTVVNNKLPTH
jgi:hypothetical protein